ncbi:Hsp33 family molecular chaperone HslO [Aerococcaceae bacterium DSM 111176]|nr:Hsp33 family molecular chaperone HslO [Aerococcaceae bacterium DSM 111176]
MSDTLMKALAFDNQVRIYVVTATDTVEEARRRHETWHTATAAFGRTLIATTLLSANLKGEDTLSVEIKGTGPIGSIHADGSPNGYIRGFVKNPHVALELNEAGKLDVSGAVGLPGSLTVRKFIQGGEPFSGQVALISGELGEDFTYYMAVSEQTPSAIGLSVLINPDESVKAAGGFMIQMLPDATEETIVAVEKQLASLGRFSDLIDLGLSPEELLAKLVGEDNYKILAQNGVQFHCHCSHDYYAAQLIRVQDEDLTAMIEEDHGAEIVCHYCNEKYHYSEEELIAIRESKA